IGSVSSGDRNCIGGGRARPLWFRAKHMDALDAFRAVFRSHIIDLLMIRDNNEQNASNASTASPNGTSGTRVLAPPGSSRKVEGVRAKTRLLRGRSMKPRSSAIAITTSGVTQYQCSYSAWAPFESSNPRPKKPRATQRITARRNATLTVYGARPCRYQRVRH